MEIEHPLACSAFPRFEAHHRYVFDHVYGEGRGEQEKFHRTVGTFLLLSLLFKVGTEIIGRSENSEAAVGIEHQFKHLRKEALRRLFILFCSHIGIVHKVEDLPIAIFAGIVYI